MRSTNIVHRSWFLVIIVLLASLAGLARCTSRPEAGIGEPGTREPDIRAPGVAEISTDRANQRRSATERPASTLPVGPVPALPDHDLRAPLDAGAPRAKPAPPDDWRPLHMRWGYRPWKL